MVPTSTALSLPSKGKLFKTKQLQTKPHLLLFSAVTWDQCADLSGQSMSNSRLQINACSVTRPKNGDKADDGLVFISHVNYVLVYIYMRKRERFVSWKQGHLQLKGQVTEHYCKIGYWPGVTGTKINEKKVYYSDLKRPFFWVCVWQYRINYTFHLFATLKVCHLSPLSS